jgi:hypothetical protein
MFDEANLDDETTEVDALAFLKAVYQSPAVPLSTRLKAASIAIEYERPRLAVTATIDGKDFGVRLDRAIERMAKAQEPKEIEAQVELEPIAPILNVPDRRFRR